MRFTYQVEQPWHRRCWVKPFVETVWTDDGGLSMVNVGKLWRGCRRDDGEGFEGVVALVPVLPQSGKRKRQPVPKRQKVGLLAVPGPLPLEPPTKRKNASAVPMETCDVVSDWAACSVITTATPHRSLGAQAGRNGCSGGEVCSGTPIAVPVPRRLVPANLENASRIRAFRSVRVFGHDGVASSTAAPLTTWPTQ